VVKVVVHPGQGSSFTTDLHGELMIVGRSSDADLQVDDKYLSRKHAKLIHRDGGWWIEDLGSRNGTRLNGNFVEEPTQLRPGDELRLCQSTILFDADEARIEPPVTASDHHEPHTRFLSASELTRLGSPQLTDSLDSVDELRRQAQRLHLLNDIHRVLDQSMRLRGVLDLILDRPFDTL
jgi:predicted component of type VI protein secretion system